MSKVKNGFVSEIDGVLKIYQKAEQDILDAIAYKANKGYRLFAEIAALERVQEILTDLIGESYKKVPPLIEKQYLLGKAYANGLANARSMTLADHGIVDQLVSSLMGNIVESSGETLKNLQRSWENALRLGRQTAQEGAAAALEATARAKATGLGVSQAQTIFLEELKKSGLTAFQGKRGKKMSLKAYAEMVTRTVSRQATNIGTVMADPEHDLYQISSHNTPCAICAPLENRVFSKSGTNPYYPPLALAFGKVDPAGPTILENSWLNIHPNCLHVILKFFEAGKTPEELAEIRQFSSFVTNPRDMDPRPLAQIKAYKQKERGREKLLNDYNQFKRYKLVLGNAMPKTFQTFLSHKLKDSDKFKDWQALYRKRNKQSKNISVNNETGL